MNAQRTDHTFEDYFFRFLNESIVVDGSVDCEIDPKHPYYRSVKITWANPQNAKEKVTVLMDQLMARKLMAGLRKAEEEIAVQWSELNQPV